MRESLRKISSQYDAVAKEYAERFADELGKKLADQEILNRFSKEVGNRRPIWDFGCGPGQTTKYLKDRGIAISGLDLSEKLLEQARSMNPGICFQRGDILDLEFEDGSIAGVVAFYAIVHFTERQVKEAFQEVFRVLRPGGIFLFTYHVGEERIHLDEFLGKVVDMDVMFFKTDFISSCLEKCGFHGLEVIERDPYPGIEYQSRRAYAFARKPT